MPQRALQHLLKITQTELARVESKLLTTQDEAESTELVDKAALLHLKEQEIKDLLNDDAEEI